MANKKTYFQQLWLSDDKFSSWISCLKTKENAFCKLCEHGIVLSNIGEGTLTSHANGTKHQTKVIDLEMARNFFKPKTTSAKVKSKVKN